MNFFIRKPKVHRDEFCRDFYDRAFRSNIRDVNLYTALCDMDTQFVIKADSSFVSVDQQLFAAEMTVLRYEVFGIGWRHEVGDKHAAAQSEFTKRYLEEHGELDIWESIEPDNQAVARSSSLGQKPDNPSGRAYLASLNLMRADSFDKWFKQGCDPKCVARAANRLSTDEAWKNGLTPVFLMLTLCERLGYDPNEDAEFHLVAIINGSYNGAREAIREVKLI